MFPSWLNQIGYISINVLTHRTNAAVVAADESIGAVGAIDLALAAPCIILWVYNIVHTYIVRHVNMLVCL